MLGGVFLMLTTGGFGVIAWGDVALITFGIVGIAEMVWGRHFPRP